jgi:hypothetical protein
VAFALAGEQRQLVHAVAQEVEAILGRSTVFYDEWYTHWFTGPDEDLLLLTVYGEKAELVVMCVSGAYGDKPWTRTEHHAVRARLRQAGTVRDRLRVLPLRVGDGDVEGILFNEIVPDIRDKTPTEAAELIVARLNLVRGSAGDLAAASVAKAPEEWDSRVHAPQLPGETGGLGQTSGREARTEQQTAEIAVKGGAVFVSYRRKLSEQLAWLVRKELTDHDFDTFVDLENLDSGEFERTILSQIEAREHFIVLLEPGSLDQIGEDGDWLRREIAHALAHGRNVVPVTAKGFEFRRDLALPPDVARLPSFNAVAIPPGYLEEAMERLRTRFLKTPSDPRLR